MTRRAALIVSLLAAGCAENAILELDLVAPDSGEVLNVQLLSTDDTYDAPEDLGVSPERFVIGADPTQISIVADREAEIELPLYVGVWTCASSECGAMEQSPTRLFRIERAFYLGQYTHLDLDLRREPATGVIEVSRCRVQGCGASDGSYCYADADGTPRHYCER